ncbi:MAG: DUF4157 domain-containing protein [Phormidesmis sp. CAN_BIN44]|nr:DUF4157 domain-containing protein [Phormidesmis sp. CAN_BIN44]
MNGSKGGGEPLSGEVRSFMEPRFGADFSQVRVHTGSEAVQMNRDLNAQAFTHKQDVYFGAGKFPAKDALTAHELTHVVQQTGQQMEPRLQRSGSKKQSRAVFDFDYTFKLEPRDEGGQPIQGLEASLELSLKATFFNPRKVGVFSFSYIRPKLSGTLKATLESDGKAVPNITTDKISGKVDLTIVEATLNSNRILPKGTTFTVSSAWKGSIDPSKNGLKNELLPSIEIIIPWE